MGMAAGQARLLSITTRMSDNELRAQLINNDKMRLATKSAQVSEAYTTALNDAQMMFTNYDADNKTSFKELTYNASCLRKRCNKLQKRKRQPECVLD